MTAKSFTEKIRDDFKATPLPEEIGVPGKARTKALPSARLIPLSDIIPDPDQPRKTFDKEGLDELASSIESKGVIEPVTVRFVEADGKYRIVTGERRFRAARITGLKEIPCVVKELNDEEAFCCQLIENLQREDLTPVDEARGIKRLVDTGLTQAEVGLRVGKSQPYISQSLKILELPQTILEQADEKGVSKDHLQQLARAEKPQDLWREILEGKSAKQIKKENKEGKNKKGRPKNFTHTITGKYFKVVVQFDSPEARSSPEIIEALGEAITTLER